jgi:hypothetical protein
MIAMIADVAPIRQFGSCGGPVVPTLLVYTSLTTALHSLPKPPVDRGSSMTPTTPLTTTRVPADRAAYLQWLREAPLPFLEALDRFAAAIAAHPGPRTEAVLQGLARAEAERARRGHPELFTWFVEHGVAWLARRPAFS